MPRTSGATASVYHTHTYHRALWRVLFRHGNALTGHQRVDHPNVLKLYNIFENEEHYHFVLE